MPDPPTEGFHRSDPPISYANFEIAEENGTRRRIVSSRAGLPPMSKKPREMPNLTECQSCGFRINTSSNGQDRLRILKSEWRIVLLCGRCDKRSVRGELCTYCLGEVAGQERFKCGECCCSVHWDCVSKFCEFAPWSYFDWRSSSICVDCWLPSKVQKLRNVHGGRRRIDNNFLGNGKRLMRGGEKDVDYPVEKRAQLVAKPHMAIKDREKSLCKALAVKAGVGKESSRGELGRKRKGVDDAELAFQLHRVMNSSPRVSRNSRLLSSSHVKRVNKRAGRNVSSVKTSAFGQRNYVSGGGVDAAVNKGFDSKDERAKGVLKEGEGSCSNNSMDSKSFSWKDLNLPKPELKFTYVRRKCISIVDGRADQYMFKYTRRRSRMIELAACKYTYLYDKSTYETETSSTAIVVHSSTESRKIPDSCILALPVSLGANGSSKNQV